MNRFVRTAAVCALVSIFRAGLVIVQVQGGKRTAAFPKIPTGGRDLIVYP